MLEKIERVKLSDEILYRLKEMIKSGQYRYGDKLPVEKQLGAIFGVSRTTVREALAVLEAEGIVVTKRGGGTYVKQVPGEFCSVEPLTSLLEGENIKILESMEVRKILECEMAALAASRATPEDIVAIKLAYRNLVEAVKQEKETAKADFELHFAIAKAARNQTLSSVICHLHDLYQKVVTTNRQHKDSPDSFTSVLEEHAAIIKAIESHQIRVARKAMEAHLERAQRLVEEVILGRKTAKNE